MTTFSRMEDSDSETCRNSRAEGLSDDESAEWEKALKAIHYSDEHVLLTPPVKNEFWEKTTWMNDKRRLGVYNTLRIRPCISIFNFHELFAFLQVSNL